MNITEAVEQMKDNLRHGALLVECPKCREEMSVQWEKGWKNTLNAKCLGRKAGWLRWEDPCGLVLSELSVNTAQMDAELARLKPQDSERAKNRRIGRGTFWVDSE